MSLLRTTIALVLVSATATPIPALADEADWYLGFGAGRSQSKLNDQKIAEDLTAAGFAPNAVYRHDHGDAYKGFAGFRLSPHFGLEGSYFDLGKFTFTAPTDPAGSVSAAIRVRGFAVDALASLPITDKFFGFAKVGVTEAQTRDTFDATLPNSISISNPSHWHANPKVGAGLQYLFTPHFAIRGEWERYRISDALHDHGNVDAWFLNLVFPMGHADAAMPVAVRKEPTLESPPPPMAAAVSTPPPAPIPPPAPPAPRRVRFNADALFGFNSDAIRPEGMRELDKFVGDLRLTTFAQVHVLGYSDKIGSSAYNLRLSQRRSDAVKSYLVTNGSVSADKITSEGRGEADPVTKPGECGEKRSAASILCLQPDRRVEIEVAGTQQ
jgi:OOP family OmpA-OmpF porin